MRPTAAAVRAVLVLSGLAGASAPPASQALSPTGSDDAWVELAPTPDESAKVDSAHRFRVYLEVIEPGGPEALWSVPLAGGAPSLLSGPMAAGDRVWAFSISPDGRRVAFTASSGRGPRRLYLVPIAAGSDGSARRADDDGAAFADVEQFAFRSDSRALGFVRWPDAASIVLLGDQIFYDGFESGNFEAWSDTTPNPCATPTSGPTMHAGTLASSQTWTANTGPHILTNNVLVPAGVDLFLEPCTEVRVRPGFDLTVLGRLYAFGTALQRITFKRDNPALPWDSIWVKYPSLGSRLDYVDVTGGGAAGASVVVEGDDTLPSRKPLSFDHVRVIGSTSYGIRLFRRAGFTTWPFSRELIVTGSGATDPTAPFPVRMSMNTVGTLPTGSYTGNASDRIQVVGEGNNTVEVDETFHDRGVPYQIGGPAGAFGLLVVDGDPTLATLTIEPGVEMRFYSAGSNIGGLFVGTSGSPVATGRLVAAGTAARPILFTGAGAAPVAGDWEGITFFGALAAGNVLDHVVIDAAGDNGGDQGFGCPPPAFPETSGALKIFSQPSAQFLTNSTISRSSTHGIFRAWTGAEVDFMAGNTFDDVPFCNQVLPKPPLPAVCPANPACPQ